jgi:uncharacterized protein involved in exopolysaccharide biosynthesis
MNSTNNRNWILTILQLKGPFLLRVMIAVVVASALLTFLFRPIYSATTILVLDSELSNVLGGLGTSIPALSPSNFIRFELFASHSLHLMQLPQIARTVIDKQGLRDRFGDKFSPEYLVQPGLMHLVWNNDGQGVRVEWISDTQTFAITGYSKEPDRAVMLSQEYAHAFLDDSANQFKDVISKLLERSMLQNQELSGMIANVDQELREIRNKYHSADPSLEIAAVLTKTMAIKTLLETDQAGEARYQLELAHLSKQAESFAKLKKVEETIAANPNVDTIKTEIRQLAGLLAAASIEYTPDHPEYKEIQKKLNTANQQLTKELAKRLSEETLKQPSALDDVTKSILKLTLDHIAYEGQMEHYNKLLANYERRMIELSQGNTEIQSAISKRDVMITALQQAMKDQYKMESILQKTVPFYRVLSSAYINKDNLGEYKYFPKRKRIVIYSFLISAFLLFFFTIGRELKANWLYYGWQLDSAKIEAEVIDVPCLEMGGLSQSDRDEQISRRIQDICASGRDRRILRITSTMTGEGKATIASALAWCYWRIGKPVILVDGDIVNHSLSTMFGASSHPGLLDIFAGSIQLNEALVELRPGVVILPVGGRDLESKAGFVSSRFDELISELTSLYAPVIYIDSPLTNNYAMFSDLLPDHDIVILAESGRHSVYELEKTAMMRKFSRSTESRKWIVINKIPEVIDLFSIRDLYHLSTHFNRSWKSLV